MIALRINAACMLVALIGCSEKPEPSPPPDSPFGRFEGEVKATWLENGKMRLNEEFAYIDPREKKWLAPAQAIVDGALIPKPFWSVIGGPFADKYRQASVVHDVACVEMAESWQAVHLMFYEACRCGGVGDSKAKLMYWAVFHFGPRWKPVSEVRVDNGNPVTVTRMVRIAPRQIDAQLLNKANEYFEDHDPTLTDIESLEFEN